MKTTSTIIMLAVVGIVVALAGAANAATITWGTPMAISDPSDVSTEGILAIAVNVGSDTAQEVNGVIFQLDGWAVSITSGVYSVTLPYSWYNANGGFWSGDEPGGSESYGSALNSARFHQSNRAVVNTISGLTAGSKYEIQIWSCDNRGGTEGRYGLWDNGAGGTGVTLDFDSAPYAIGTFTADVGGTQTFTNGPQGDPSYCQLGMLQVRLIPPPSRGR